MHNKKINQLLIGAMLAAMAPAVSAADIPAWNGSALGFEAGQQGLLGDMLGIRPILEENGFHYNLGYLNEMAYNAGGGYDHDKHLAYIDQVALTFTQDLERWTGIPDARLEGNIVNRNHDDNLTTKRLQDPRVSSTIYRRRAGAAGRLPALAGSPLPAALTTAA
ncbi:putative carbohydrate-selective porin [Klebsiella pneumoniae subsp. pneumoniae]|uniref:Putative carbohydrate-selective porin n=1 Tax=Klebsiella pneumoniae subsp. pneumoniae TaxID=72407 RepID=A0A377ZBH0_KLEPN|nr:putative carbohydrate-selective porin [Klebsiella pneumoniae subsp. pneumoniae]